MSDTEDGHYDTRVIDREGFEEFYPRMMKKIFKKANENIYRTEHRSGKGGIVTEEWCQIEALAV